MWGLAKKAARFTQPARSIVGPFSERILPDLEEDLLPASERACNEILHGSTAGFVQLPEEYEAVNFYSLYRPAPEDGIEFDWGSWVAGVEQVDNRYVVTFLVPFAWEG